MGVFKGTINIGCSASAFGAWRSTMTDFALLQKRLYRLERLTRTLQASLVAICLIAGLTVIAGMMPARPQVLEAESLVLTDGAGRVRGLFTAGGDEPALVLTDSRGIKRLRFRIEDTGPTLSLYDSNQSLRMQLATSDEISEFTLLNEKQQPRLKLRSSGVEPQIVVHDSEGRPRAKLFVLDGEGELGSGFALADGDGKQRVLVTALPDGVSVIRAGDQILVPAGAKTAGQTGTHKR
jgi:hypothetical protein